MGFPGAPTGIDVLDVARTGWLPQISTGMAGRVAGTGQVGGGLVQPPQQCLEQALAALAEEFRAAGQPVAFQIAPGQAADMTALLVSSDDEGGDGERFRRSTPPENEVPAIHPVSAVLVRTDVSALSLTGIRVFSTGIAFTIDLRCRPEALPESAVDLGSLLWRRGRGEAQLPVGVELADGRRVSNLPRRGLPGGDGDGVVFHQGSGSGQQLSLVQEWWLSPLPPAGPLRIVVRCDLLGLPETSLELDGAAVRAAAEDVVVLWPWVSPEALQPADPVLPDVPADSWFAG